MILLAVLQLSGLVTAITGKMGGTVFQNSPYGTIGKNNRYKRSRQSPINYERRNMFAALASMAHSFTDADRATMTANGLLFTRPTKAGPDTPYDWWSWFMAFGYNRLLIGQTPVITTVAPYTFPDFGDVTVLPKGGTTDWELDGVDNFDSTTTFLIFAGPIVPAGQAFKKGQVKLIQVSAGAEGVITVLGSNYVAIYGNSAGDGKIWFYVLPIATATGQAGTPRITKADAQ